jgi:hypothetical protein
VDAKGYVFHFRVSEMGRPAVVLSHLQDIIVPLAVAVVEVGKGVSLYMLVAVDIHTLFLLYILRYIIT